jgi:hypothetical protein
MSEHIKAERSEDGPYLLGLAARLRSLALTEPRIADQLYQMAVEAEDRAKQIEAVLGRTVSKP